MTKYAFRDIAVVVTDGAKAKKFWKEQVGFDIKHDQGHWITVAAPGSDVLVHLCQGDKADPGNTGIAWAVDDVFRAEKEMAGRGVKFTKAAGKTEWGTTNARFADPDGNEFWLFEEAHLKGK
jgi:predicted enzyme related to lactoylglutathione lyase